MKSNSSPIDDPLDPPAAGDAQSVVESLVDPFADADSPKAGSSSSEPQDKTIDASSSSQPTEQADGESLRTFLQHMSQEALPMTARTSHSANIPKLKLTQYLEPKRGETPQAFYDRAVQHATHEDVILSCSSSSEPFYQLVSIAGLGRYDFTDDPLDMAMRKFFLHEPLPPESQQIDRLLDAFAAR